MATIRDVAKEANVSIATVSRILNNDKNYSVSPETRRRVFAAAETLHYVPNPSYTKKKGEKVSVAAINNLTTERQQDSYYLAILEGARDYLSAHGYSLDLVLAQHDVAEPAILNKVLKNKIQGLILFTSLTPDVIQTFKKNIPHLVGVDTKLYDIDNVRYNTFEAGTRAMRYLIESGHKKIAFIGGNLPSGYTYYMERYDAYRIAMRMNDYPIAPEWIIDCGWDRQSCFQQTQKLLDCANRPTAIFVASDNMAMVCMNAIAQKGLKIPEDISVIGISDVPESKYLTPPLTTISIPQNELGKVAAQLLIQRIEGDTTIVKQIYLPTQLVIRDSVKNIST